MPRPGRSRDLRSIGVRECHERVAPATGTSVHWAPERSPHMWHSDSLWYLPGWGTIWRNAFPPGKGESGRLALAPARAFDSRSIGERECHERVAPLTRSHLSALRLD